MLKMLVLKVLMLKKAKRDVISTYNNSNYKLT